MKRVFLILMTILVAVPLINGAENISDRKIPSLGKALAISDIWIDVNRMDGVFRNNGTWMYDNIAGGEGLFWPKGTHLSPIFAGGQWLGASVDGEVRVAGVQHSATEFQAGEIISPGVAASHKAGEYKWYALYPGGVGDWTSWPVDQGAPVDANGNPLLIGDVTAFSVWNDLAPHTEYGSEKLNAEIRQTVFAFNRADALGDMIFIKWQIINKGASDWDSTHFSIWLDPDLGYATDDLVGCDTTLGLGFVYNATDDDQTYGTAPPAAGIDFFQGPIIDEVGSTVSLPDGTVLTDKTMLKMTSFVYYDNDDSPKGNPASTGDVWNYMRGIWRNNLKITEGDRGTTVGNPPTDFMFSGDPEAGTGWLDYNEDDRRFLMTTGPFDMPVWVDENLNGAPDFGETGVQEIVAVVIVARGDNNLNSVTVLKQVDELAQLAYDLNFNLASAPIPPAVAVSELPNEVVLTWNEASEFDATGIAAYSSTDPIVAQAYDDTVVMDNVEKVIDDSTYNFYGYTVYQYADVAGGNPVVLEHWDNGGEAAAVPYVSQRFARILVNKHPRVGEVGAPLINGKPYYFGLVAEGYLGYGAPKVMPSAATIVTAVPQFEPGTEYQAAYNDTIKDVVHSVIDPAAGALSEGSITAWVVDPSKTTGDDYKVTFNDDATWNLINTTTVDTVLKNQTNQRMDDAYTVVDGLMVKVSGADPTFTDFQVVSNAGGEVLEGASADWYDFPGLGQPTDAQQVAAGKWLIHTWPNGTRGAYSTFLARTTQYTGGTGGLGHLIPHDFEIRFTATGSKGYDYWWNFHPAGGFIDLPFELWDIGNVSDPDDDFQLFTYFYDMDANGEFNLMYDASDPASDPGWADHEASGGTNDPWTDVFYWMIPDDDTPGTQGYDNLVAGLTADNSIEPAWSGEPGGPTLADGSPGAWSGLHRMTLVNWNGGDVTTATSPADYNQQYPEVGTVFRIITAKPNSTNDIYTFTAPAAKTVVDSNLVVDLDKINVVPNPYYGYHSGELNIFDRWVQFTYLPPKATIRIYDLAGQLIRKLEKDDPTTTFLQWDLGNAYDLPVASGVYVYVVDTDYGQKIGKMAVFTPNERVDIW